MGIGPLVSNTMPHSWVSLKFAELAEHLDGAVEWLARMGVDVTKSRLGRYRRDMLELSAAAESKDIDRLKVLYESALTPLFEANEIVGIYDAFAGSAHENYVRDRIQALSSGPISYTDEDTSASNRARNLAFELQMAARLLAAGLSLEEKIRSDITTRVGTRVVLLECKRPHSEAGVERSVMDAKHQLKQHCDGVDGSQRLGVVAVDLTRLTNPDFELLRGITTTEGAEFLAGYLRNYHDTHKRLWARLHGTKAIGVILRLSVLAHFSDDRSLTYCQQYAIAARPGVRSLEESTLRQLSNAMESATGWDASLRA